MASKHGSSLTSLPKLPAPAKRVSHSALSAKGKNKPTASKVSREDSSPPADQPNDAELKLENATLKEELATIKSLYAQLTHEAPSENFSESRVHLLKSQVFQLERQVLILNQAVTSRINTLADLQNTMDMFLQRLQGVAKRGGVQVTLTQQELDDLIDKVKVIKGKLAKGEQMVDHLAQPLLSVGQFLKPAKKLSKDCWGDHSGPATILDVCKGGTAHINLKYVSHLESKLACLYGNLCKLQASLDTTPTRTAQLTRPMEDHLSEVVQENCKMVGDCCHDLMCLSLLVPEAPWGALKGTELQPVTVDAILERLPPSIRGKMEVKSVLEASVKSFNYQQHMASVKCSGLQAELQFHKSVYDAQVNYIQCLFQALRDGYKVFEQSLQETVCHPVQGILTLYAELSQEVSDEALKRFLLAFKSQHPQLLSMVEKLKVPSNLEQGVAEIQAPG